MAEYNPPNTVNPIFNPQIFNLRDKVGTTITAGDITEIDEEILAFQEALNPYTFIGTGPTSQISYTAGTYPANIVNVLLEPGAYIITINGQIQFPTTSYNWVQSEVSFSVGGVNTSLQQANIQTPPNVPRPTILNVTNTFFVNSNTIIPAQPTGQQVGVFLWVSSNVNSVIAANSFLITIVRTIGY